MLESEVKALQGSYPNIIFKKKLTPLPLFNQNRHDLHSLNASPSKEKSLFGSITPRPEMQASVLASPRKPFLNDFKTVNNYGRLCDQPFLEFSNFHSEQVFGSGGGKKKIILEPIKKKQKITKMFTLRDSLIGRSTLEFGKSSLIKIQDYATAGAAPQITINQKPKEKVKDKNKQKENQAVIKKVYKIGDYEAVVGFYSLEVVLTVGEAETKKSFSLRIGKDKLRKIFKFSHSEMTANVLESLVFKDGKLKMKITKEAKQDRYIGDETYPEKKENLTATIDGQDYKATIYFPHLEVSISKLGYTEKVMLKPLFLANLYEENFNNLQDYIQKFTLPDQVTKTKEEIHHEELKKLPTIIKKVVKTLDYGGLVLFKSLEVHLKNTSELEPETFMHESSLTPMAQKIMRKKKKDINAVLLRLRLDEVLKLLKCSAEEITNFVKDSVCVEEGSGFEVRLDQEKLNNHHQRDKHEPESYPEYGEKFTIRFNRFIYEGYLKFPTLELYIPETNYKDVIQLKPYQLRDLIEDEFKNIEAYLHYFKKPNANPEPTHLTAHNLNLGDETPREFVQSMEIATIPTSETPMAQPIAEAVEESVEKSVEEPAEKLVEEPVEEPVEKLIEEPAEEPVVKPVEEPVAESVEKSVEEPVAEPVEKSEEPVVESAAEAIEEPVEVPAEPVAEPVEEPAGEPFEEPVAEPVAEPIEKQVEEPVVEPVEKQVEEPVEKPEEPVVEPAAEAIEEPVEVSVAEPVAEPVEEPVEKPEEPAGESGEEPVVESVEAPIEKQVEEPVAEPAEEPVEEPVKKPAEESIAEPIEKLVEESAEEPAEKPVEEPVAEPAEEPVEEPVEKPAEEPIAEPVEEPVVEPVAEEKQ